MNKISLTYGKHKVGIFNNFPLSYMYVFSRRKYRISMSEMIFSPNETISIQNNNVKHTDLFIIENYSKFLMHTTLDLAPVIT
jgi:hypothetical protein